VPAEHALPPVQALPHIPQLLLSTCVFTQLEPHSVPVHMPHVPLLQPMPVVHLLPHDPQLFALLFVSTQTLTPLFLHRVMPVPPQMHLLPLHCAEEGHLLPQAPQFWLSIDVTVQLPLQSVNPAGQMLPDDELDVVDELDEPVELDELEAPPAPDPPAPCVNAAPMHPPTGSAKSAATEPPTQKPSFIASSPPPPSCSSSYIPTGIFACAGRSVTCR
jgi:hypothetical protein